ncbi:hypothetical protein [Aureimonas sp. AU40]|uniref:hypothetical protein n=1 Tax=Aureimonas sp. AU40 TaxID=1637747 RepID=UPI0007803BC2|nr:hypothetical protein [Aureimonas sp. AU40]
MSQAAPATQTLTVVADTKPVQRLLQEANRRIDDLLEANNRYLEEARAARRERDATRVSMDAMIRGASDERGLDLTTLSVSILCSAALGAAAMFWVMA